MKRTKFLGVGLFFFILMVISGCNSKNRKNSDTPPSVDVEASEKGGIPAFERTDHNFGNISPGEEVGARFSFKNKGDAPLIIKRVSTGCGCTVAEYSKEPVAPGETGFVEIIFDSEGKYGAQFQEAQVYFQGIKIPSRLSIVAQVIKK